MVTDLGNGRFKYDLHQVGECGGSGAGKGGGYGMVVGECRWVWVAVFHRTAAMMEAAGGVDAMLTGACCLCLCSLSSRGRYWRRQRGRPQQVEK